ncbi:hypothetical protein Y032_0411g970 [Ancylostoma ceylanicum]|uniref:Uncharacterized protein n=1 Tax=Ancylostoma ceylanicum TaxID=53326 RepID=A0A016X1W4_9BILA|nr:hypothetical protein Y032_0411g970 [Ancylostoma ceylanicum]
MWQNVLLPLNYEDWQIRRPNRRRKKRGSVNDCEVSRFNETSYIKPHVNVSELSVSVVVATFASSMLQFLSRHPVERNASLLTYLNRV